MVLLEISSDPWNSLIFHHSWVLVTSPCHKIILWSLPSSFILCPANKGGLNYAAHLMTEPLESACYHIISGIFRSSFNFGLCFKTISLFDLLQSLSYSDWITLVGTISFASGSLVLSSAMAPLVARSFCTHWCPMLPQELVYTFLFVFDYIPSTQPFYHSGEIGTPEQIKPGIFLSFPTQTYNGLGYTSKGKESLTKEPVSESKSPQIFIENLLYAQHQEVLGTQLIVTSPNSFPWKRHYVTWFSTALTALRSYGAILGDGGLLNGASLGHRRTADRLCIV